MQLQRILAGPPSKVQRARSSATDAAVASKARTVSDRATITSACVYPTPAPRTASFSICGGRGGGRARLGLGYRVAVPYDPTKLTAPSRRTRSRARTWSGCWGSHGRPCRRRSASGCGGCECWAPVLAWACADGFRTGNATTDTGRSWRRGAGICRCRLRRGALGLERPWRRQEWRRGERAEVLCRRAWSEMD